MLIVKKVGALIEGDTIKFCGSYYIVTMVDWHSRHGNVYVSNEKVADFELPLGFGDIVEVKIK